MQIIHITFYTFIQYLAKTTNVSDVHCNIGCFSFVLSLNQNLTIFLKSLFKF